MGGRLFSDKESNPEDEQGFNTVKWNELQCSGSAQPLRDDDANNYHQFLSLYTTYVIHGKTELHICDAEKRRQDVKILETSIIDDGTCITQLPNGELFCYGRSCPYSGVTLIIDRSYGFRLLPSGTPCHWSSALYFNNNIYCFGGYQNSQNIALSRKFDLSKNRWINLTHIPLADYCCHSVIFNGNIVISGTYSSNLWLYSIEIDAFSTIPVNFAAYIRKILINAERLYLIEWDDDHGSIYEGEDEYHWKKISKWKAPVTGTQMYCLYNKGKIYFSLHAWMERYFEFDLKKKIIAEFHCENPNLMH